MNKFVIYIIGTWVSFYHEGIKKQFIIFYLLHSTYLSSIIYVLCSSLNGILSNGLVVAFNQSYENSMNNS